MRRWNRVLLAIVAILYIFPLAGQTKSPYDLEAKALIDVGAWTIPLAIELTRVNKVTKITTKKNIPYYVVDYSPPPVQLPPQQLQTANFSSSANSPTVAPLFGNSAGNSGASSQSLLSRTLRPALTTAQPVAPPSPELIYLDGTGNSLIAVDLNSLTVLSQVVVPTTSGLLAIRPTGVSAAREVWAANGGLSISVADLQAQKVVATIATTASPTAAGTSQAIVFTPDGSTAFEAMEYLTPDSAGNGGALLIFDAANHKLTSMQPLKDAPRALAMAPDGTTAYILDSRGNLTYFDILSGTADLSVSTFPAGAFGGITMGPIFIHPDGTRLFWNINTQVYVFDLTARKIIANFNSGLPSTSATTMTMSQDGGQLYLSNGMGNVVVLDSFRGKVLITYATDPSTQVFGGPPIAP